MKQILCVICFDTKWLSVLFKTVIIQSDDHNVPHYAYYYCTCVGLVPQMTQIRSKWRLHAAITTSEQQMLVYWKLTSAELAVRV